MFCCILLENEWIVVGMFICNCTLKKCKIIIIIVYVYCIIYSIFILQFLRISWTIFREHTTHGRDNIFFPVVTFSSFCSLAHTNTIFIFKSIKVYGPRAPSSVKSLLSFTVYIIAAHSQLLYKIFESTNNLSNFITMSSR